MEKIILDNINISKESRSYIDSLHALLLYTDLFDKPKFMLSGMTGMAFRFIIHKRLLPSSLDMYNWKWENWRALNTLGIYNETYTGSQMDSTFPLYQKNAIHKIKASINAGKPVLTWGLGKSNFCLINGYSDIDNVFFYRQRNSTENDVILYDNFGLVDEGKWYFQIVGDKVEKDIRDIFKESLEIAISSWCYDNISQTEYCSGRKAYINLINALETNNLDEQGIYYIIGAYITSKKEISMYMNEVAEEIPSLVYAAMQYNKLSDAFSHISAIPLVGEYKDDIHCIPQVLDIVYEAMRIEERAILEVEKYMQEVVSNKKINPERLKKL